MIADLKHIASNESTVLNVLLPSNTRPLFPSGTSETTSVFNQIHIDRWGAILLLHILELKTS